MSASLNPKLAAYLDNIPMMHTWDSGKTWNTGGFEKSHLKPLAELLQGIPGGPSVIETGAGNSTLTFLLSGAKEVISIAPDDELFARIKSTATDLGIDLSPLTCMSAFSEDALPPLAAKRRLQFDFALLDGGHGWPTVFVDFCYLFEMTKKGGYMMIDDVPLYSVKELARLMRTSWQFKFVADLGKSLIFQKTCSNIRMDDFGGQPYILGKTKADKEAGKLYDTSA